LYVHDIKIISFMILFLLQIIYVDNLIRKIVITFIALWNLTFLRNSIIWSIKGNKVRVDTQANVEA